jgi:hypothetical protein
LDGDQMLAIRLHDTKRDLEPPRLLDRLVAGDDPAAPVDQNGSAGAVLTERALERRATAIGAAIGVVGIRLEIDEPKRMTDGSCGHGHDLRLSGAIAPLNGQVWCRGGIAPEQQAAGEKDDE